MASSSTEIRKKFLDYFVKHNHKEIKSASLIPQNDPTLLFVNAGMVPFKDIFLGREQVDYKRATSSQCCVRAGGKHNDLEQVGYTARHHTMFEMLGNFSFGDYFKREAIQYAWKFLTEELSLPVEKLWVTVYEDDTEAEAIWLNEMNIDPQRFSRCGAVDNFWSMGDTGPCGPCSEIFYDHGADIFGGPPGSPDQEGDRYVEIWNLVFMQYDKQPSGDLMELPNPSVDTGMGLERLCAVLQGVHNNYDTDLFLPIIEAIKKLADKTAITHTSVCAIADHIRSCSFMITAGIVPGNEGRGYVLRRIIRRAIRHGYQIGIKERFFSDLLTPLLSIMGDAYPELIKEKSFIQKVLLQEEQQFAKTLEQGMALLETDIAKLSGNIIPGKTVFRLYDTYGFPPDLTGDIAREKNLQLDLAGFEKQMAKQRQQSQAASQFSSTAAYALNIEAKTTFSGYHCLEDMATIVAIFYQDKQAPTLTAKQQGVLVLSNTPFYAEAGGQVADTGVICGADGQIFEVQDTQKYGEAYYHFGTLLSGQLTVGDKVSLAVAQELRNAIVLNHSATHLLHAALRQLLGEHVTQKGSLVAADRLRFDFSHFAALTEEECASIEQMVNEKIRENLPVSTEILTPDEAATKGAIALFGEKYGDKVRVLQMGDFSIELCGGTHVKATGEIGLFKIISEGGVAAGIRRLEAVTGSSALLLLNNYQQQLNQVAHLLKTKPDVVVDKVSQLLSKQKQLEKDVQKLQAKVTSGSGRDLSDTAENINGIQLVTAKFEGVDLKTLRNTLDQLKNKLQTAVVVLATVHGKKIQLVAGVTKTCTDKIHAGNVINFVAQQVGGKGGGRPDMAQAGGDDPAELDTALASVKGYIEQLLVK